MLPADSLRYSGRGMCHDLGGSVMPSDADDSGTSLADAITAVRRNLIRAQKEGEGEEAAPVRVWCPRRPSRPATAHQPKHPVLPGARSAPACGCPPAAPDRAVSPGWSAAGNSGARSRPPGAATVRSLRSRDACDPCPRPSSSSVSRLSSTTSAALGTQVPSRRPRRRSREVGTRPSDWGARTWRHSSSIASQVGGIAQRAPDHHLEVGATWCIRLTASADLPMPPMPSTLTTRQRSCDHPLGQGGHLPLAPIEAWHRQRIAPIHPRPLRSSGPALIVARVCSTGSGATGASRDVCAQEPLEPQLIQ